jgi:hypothetical protein
MASRNYHQTNRFGDLLIQGSTITSLNGDITFSASEGSNVVINYGTGTTTIYGATGANAAPRKNPYVVTVSTSSSGGGDFTSIAAAVDSITDSSDSQPYSIRIYPGVYTEPEIDISTKSNISIDGLDIRAVVVQPDGNHHVFNLGVKNEISFLTISGAAVGYAGINVDDIGDFCSAHKVTFMNCDTAVRVNASITETDFYGEYLDINGKFTNGVKVTTTSTGTSYTNLENFYVYMENPNATTYGVYADGLGTEVYTRTCEFDGFGFPGTIGLRAANGAYLTVMASGIEDLEKGVWNPNVGAGSTVQLLSTDLDECVSSVLVQHPNTVGIINGVMDDHTKVDISAASKMTFLATDKSDGEVHLSDIINMRFDDGTTTDVSTLWLHNPGMGVMSGGMITISSGLQISIAPGFGYCHNETTSYVSRHDWGVSTLTLPASQSNYIYFTSSDVLSYSTSIPDLHLNIVLGRVVTNASSVEFIDPSQMNVLHHGNQIATYQRNAIGSIYRDGSLVTEINPTGSAFKLNVGSGEYFFGSKQYLPSGNSSPGGLVFETFYRNGSGGWTTYTGAVVLQQYDNGSGTLANIPSGEYAKHSLYIIGDGVYEKYFLVVAQETHPSLGQAETGNLASPPTYFTDAVALIGAIIVQQGASSISEIIDTRPIIGYKPPASIGGGVIYHSDLLGLNSDDHTQYLLTNGGRALAGDLDIGGNNILNAALVNGINISSHASRHLPNGADPLATAIPLSVGATNQTGTANSFARSDHVHSIDLSTFSTTVNVSGAVDYIPIYRNLLSGSYKITVDNMNIDYFRLDGTRALTGNVNVGSHAVSGVTTLTANDLVILTGATIKTLTLQGAITGAASAQITGAIVGPSSLQMIAGTISGVTTITTTNAIVSTFTGGTVNVTGGIVNYGTMNVSGNSIVSTLVFTNATGATIILTGACRFGSVSSSGVVTSTLTATGATVLAGTTTAALVSSSHTITGTTTTNGLVTSTLTATGTTILAGTTTTSLTSSTHIITGTTTTNGLVTSTFTATGAATLAGTTIGALTVSTINATGAATFNSSITGPTSITMNNGSISRISTLSNTGGSIYTFPLGQSGTLHLDTTVLATGSSGDGYYVMVYNTTTRQKKYREFQQLIPHGEIYVEYAIGSGYVFSPSLSNTWYHLVTPGSLGNSTGALSTVIPTSYNSTVSQYVDMPTGGVVRYTGNDDVCFHTAWTISISTNTSATRSHYFAVAKTSSGVTTLVPGSQVRLSTTNSLFFVSTAIHSAMDLANGDMLSLAYLENGGTNQITIGSMNIFIMGMPC